MLDLRLCRPCSLHSYIRKTERAFATGTGATAECSFRTKMRKLRLSSLLRRTGRAGRRITSSGRTNVPTSGSRSPTSGRSRSPTSGGAEALQVGAQVCLQEGGAEALQVGAAKPDKMSSWESIKFEGHVGAWQVVTSMRCASAKKATA